MFTRFHAFDDISSMCSDYDAALWVLIYIESIYQTVTHACTAIIQRQQNITSSIVGNSTMKEPLQSMKKT